MKKIFFAIAFASAALISCKRGGGAKLENAQDSLAYVIGLQMGQNIRGFDSTLRVEVIARGIADAINGQGSMTAEEGMAYWQHYMMDIMPARIKAESEKWLAEVGQSGDSTVKTASGLIYRIIEPGDATRLTAVDTFETKYKGFLPGGKEFESSDRKGEPLRRAYSAPLIEGWKEALQLIGKGGRIEIWVPAELGYGVQGNGEIRPNEATRFEIELVDIIPGDTTATAHP